MEDDPATYAGDGAYSSAGAFEFQHPWIDASKTYYGVISREDAASGGEQGGYASAQCGRLVRHALDDGRKPEQHLAEFACLRTTIKPVAAMPDLADLHALFKKTSRRTRRLRLRIGHRS